MYIHKKKPLSRLLFPGKIGLLFLTRTKPTSKVIRSKSKFDISYFAHPFISWSNFCKIIMVPAISSFAAMSHKGHYRKIITGISKFGCFSRCHVPIFEKKKIRIPDAEFNAELIVTNSNPIN